MEPAFRLSFCNTLTYKSNARGCLTESGASRLKTTEATLAKHVVMSGSNERFIPSWRKIAIYFCGVEIAAPFQCYPCSSFSFVSAFLSAQRRFLLAISPANASVLPTRSFVMSWRIWTRDWVLAIQWLVVCSPLFQEEDWLGCSIWPTQSKKCRSYSSIVFRYLVCCMLKRYTITRASAVWLQHLRDKTKHIRWFWIIRFNSCEHIDESVQLW